MLMTHNEDTTEEPESEITRRVRLMELALARSDAPSTNLKYLYGLQDGECACCGDELICGCMAVIHTDEIGAFDGLVCEPCRLLLVIGSTAEGMDRLWCVLQHLDPQPEFPEDGTGEFTPNPVSSN